MNIIKILFLLSFMMIWCGNEHQEKIAIWFTIMFGLVWLGKAILDFLNESKT